MRQYFFAHAAVQRHLHMTQTRCKTIVGACERGGGGWKHDIVAVAVPANEQISHRIRLDNTDALHPAATQPHLSTVDDGAESPQPGPPMWRAYCEYGADATDPLISCSDALAASPPMLWQTRTGARPVVRNMASTAASICGA